MSRTLRIRLRAEFDLDELVEQISKRDELAALRFRSRVEETVERIFRWPNLGTQRETRSGRHVRLRQVIRYRRFVVIYTVTDQLIEILRVVRGLRNFDVFLPD